MVQIHKVKGLGVGFFLFGWVFFVLQVIEFSCFSGCVGQNPNYCVLKTYDPLFLSES